MSFIKKSLKINENISIIRQEMNYEKSYKIFQVDSTVTWWYKCKPWPYSNFGNRSVFKKRGLHFVLLNINSLPSKKEELRQVAKDTNSAVIGLSETKLDKTIFDSEIFVPNYFLIRIDRNRKGGGVACYIRTIWKSMNSLYEILELKQNFWKNKVVTGKTLFFVIGPFCTPCSILFVFKWKMVLKPFEKVLRFSENLFQR